MTALPSLPRPGDRVDRYEVLSEVAHGGMGTLYAVRRAGPGGFDRVLAMKIMLPTLCSNRSSVDMFLDEARIAAGIEHPNVVQVFDVEQWQGLPYLIMEYVRGQSLSRLIRAAKKSKTPIPTAFSSAVLLQVADGLHAAHESRGSDGELLGVVHRDVSPQNIMISYAGDVKVLDFGVAAARGRITSTRTGELKGKLCYVAPEIVAAHDRPDRRADVWSLGVVAWELFAGRRLFRSANDAATLWNVVRAEVPHLGQLRPDLPTSLVAPIMACLARDRDQRLPSCADLARRLRPAVEELGDWRRDGLAGQMRQWFVREEMAEDVRLRELSDTEDPPSESSLGELSPAQLVPRDAGTPPPALGTLPAPPRVARGRRWLVAVLAVVVLVGMVALVAVRTGDGSSPASRSATSSASAPGTERLTVEIGDNVRLVLVDGMRHDERPLIVDLPAGGSATIELFGVAGQVARFVVTSADEGRRLSITTPEPSPSQSLVGSADAGPAKGSTTSRPRPRPGAGGRTTKKPKPKPQFTNPYQ